MFKDRREAEKKKEDPVAKWAQERKRAEEREKDIAKWREIVILDEKAYGSGVHEFTCPYTDEELGLSEDGEEPEITEDSPPEGAKARRLWEQQRRDKDQEEGVS